MVTARSLKAAHIAARAGYHSIGARIIRRVAVMAITAADLTVFKSLGVHAVVAGCTVGGLGCHTTSKGAELSCEIYYSISFWSWRLTCKYPHFVEISTFRGYYPHFVEISAFHVYIRISWILSASCGNIHVPWILSAFFPFYLSNFTHLVKVTGAHKQICGYVWPLKIHKEISPR